MRTRTATQPSADAVYERVRTLIVGGRIAPGTRLVETELAGRLAVSRTPVREAMRRLAHEGLATMVGTGAKTRIAVSPATREDLADLFAIIGALEGVAGRGVARLTSQARRSLVAILKERHEAFRGEAQARSRHFDRFFAAHDAFHDTFVAACASARLQLLIRAVRPQVQRYELLYANHVGHDFSDSLREHRRIIGAFRAGSADDVERAIRANWSNSAARLAAGSSAAPVALGDYLTDAAW